MDIINTAIGIIGFGFTIWQVWQAKTAARAARDSAKDAVKTIRRLYAISNMRDVAGRAKAVHDHLTAKNFASAAASATELRGALARYQHPADASSEETGISWIDLTRETNSVCERIVANASSNRWGKQECENLVVLTQRIHSHFEARTSQLATPQV